MSLLSFLLPRVRAYSLAWSLAWKLTEAHKVLHLSVILFSPLRLFVSLFWFLTFSSLLSLFFPFLFSLFPPVSLPSSPQFHVSLAIRLFLPIYLQSLICLSTFLSAYFLCVCVFSQSLLPDVAAYLNHCLVSAGPLLQLHNLRSNSVVKQNNLKNFAQFGLALCQAVIGPRCVFPPYGSYRWLLAVKRVSRLICVCDLVWYDSFCFGKETSAIFFLATETSCFQCNKLLQIIVTTLIKQIKHGIICLESLDQVWYVYFTYHECETINLT